ncbi:MAG: hypothetical protein JWP13_470, partial [Candidatus Saccharibacteria bacterium]|nr:hypothetical protein [Candidatus Saccharibacteria bacterium]
MSNRGAFSKTNTNKKVQIVIALALILLLFISLALPSVVHAATPARVTSITDGDTFKVLLDGRTQTVRIVGVNTPEKNECYAAEATAAMKSLVGSKRVWLETDAQQGNKDKYG